MKTWWNAALLSLIPIFSVCGVHHFYLNNNRKGYAILGIFLLVFITITNKKYIFGVHNGTIFVWWFMLITLLGWYNTYGYIRFGLIKVDKKNNFWNDKWMIN